MSGFQVSLDDDEILQMAMHDIATILELKVINVQPIL
jgi:hypothetical protein